MLPPGPSAQRGHLAAKILPPTGAACCANSPSDWLAAGEAEVLDKKVAGLGLCQLPSQYQALVRELLPQGEVHDAEVSLISKPSAVKAVQLTASMIEFGV
jgi:hypothetical protein